MPGGLRLPVNYSSTGVDMKLPLNYCGALEDVKCVGNICVIDMLWSMCHRYVVKYVCPRCVDRYLHVVSQMY